MGHAIHFLERLERTEIEETERALELYNHPRLLAWLLFELNLPESVERWALSLNGEDKGPFLVMTREGHFVTCLGRGMTTMGLMVVNFGRYEALREKSLGRLDEVDRALVKSKKKTYLEETQDRLLKAGRLVYREDIRRLIAFHPLVASSHLEILCRRFTLLQKMREMCLAKQGQRKIEEKELRRIWEYQYSLENLLTLIAHDGARGLEMHLRPIFPKSGERAKTDDEFYMEIRNLLWSVFRQGSMSNACRCIWSAGKIGKALVGTLKASMQEPSGLLFGLATLSLVCIALRHKKLHEEIEKFLFAPSWFEHPHFLLFQRSMSVDWLPAMKQLFLDPEEVHQTTLEAFREFLYSSRPGIAEHYKRAEDIPEDLAFVLCTTVGSDYLETRSNLFHVLVCLPWLSRVEAEELYLPEELASLSIPWFPEETLEDLGNWKSYLTKSKPPPVVSKGSVGVNEPCPCGSGRKFKQCCKKKASGVASAEKELESVYEEIRENSKGMREAWLAYGKALEEVALLKGEEGGGSGVRGEGTRKEKG